MVANPAAKDSTDELPQLIQQQLSLARGLQENLSNFHIALTESNTDAINNCVDSNASILTQLDSNNAAIQAWLKVNGSKSMAVHDAIARHEKKEVLGEIWNDYKQLIAECQLTNYSNSVLAHGQLQHTQNALGILLGVASDCQSDYANNGELKNSRLSRSIAKA
ncbi:MAG: flagellar export chaperone FlgN [Pseudomonadota bacterium]